jgi:hypothetical protein
MLQSDIKNKYETEVGRAKKNTFQKMIKQSKETENFHDIMNIPIICMASAIKSNNKKPYQLIYTQKPSNFGIS